jgi:hypothetical protein
MKFAIGDTVLREKNGHFGVIINITRGHAMPYWVMFFDGKDNGPYFCSDDALHRAIVTFAGPVRIP